MSRIPATFDRLARERRKALIPFVTAGDPDRAATVPLMHALAAAGADLIELGVPFSDPMADGPTIQRASERALKNGVTLRAVLDMVRRFREADALTPVVLMGYANPIEAMGERAFIAAAALAGVDGVLVVDDPPEECAGFARALREAGIDPILLLAPTSTEVRIRNAAATGSGYIYYVSLTGVTGAASLDLDAVARRLPHIRAACGMPVAIGFGIRDAASARRAGDVADGVVIGSRLIEEIENAPSGAAIERAGAFLARMREALDAPATQQEPTT